jgi:hypothetical protein
LATLRGLANHGRRLRAKGMKKVQGEVEPLNGRELGRLLAVLEGEGWLDRRNLAMVSLMALLGHENLTTTARYLHPDRAQVGQMVEDL